MLTYFATRVAVTEAGCWEWQQCRNEGGYGRLRFNNQGWSAHRLAWSMANGPIPDGLCVLHKCDNPPCCNPDHLELGTKTENNRQMYERGRQKQYVPNELHSEIVRRYRRGETQRNIAEDLGVHRTTISLILHQHGAGRYKREGTRGLKRAA